MSVGITLLSLVSVMAFSLPGPMMPVACCSPASTTSFDSFSISFEVGSPDLSLPSSPALSMYSAPIMRPFVILAFLLSALHSEAWVASSITSEAPFMIHIPAPFSIVSISLAFSWSCPTGALEPASAARFFVPGMCVTVKGWYIAIFLLNSMSL